MCILSSADFDSFRRRLTIRCMVDITLSMAVTIHLKDHNINISIGSKNKNLPVITYCFVIIKNKEQFGPQLMYDLAHDDIKNLDIFGYFRT